MPECQLRALTSTRAVQRRYYADWDSRCYCLQCATLSMQYRGFCNHCEDSFACGLRSRSERKRDLHPPQQLKCRRGYTAWYCCVPLSGDSFSNEVTPCGLRF
jgi:hypothetical protein